jgi:hypothetical protein
LKSFGLVDGKFQNTHLDSPIFASRLCWQTRQNGFLQLMQNRWSIDPDPHLRHSIQRVRVG